MQSRSILSPASGFMTRCGFRSTLNPAVGCKLGCSYCYAASFSQNVAPAGAQWGEWTRLKATAAELLAAEPSLAGQAVSLSSTTDPYQPAERDARITRGVQAIISPDLGEAHRVLLRDARALIVQGEATVQGRAVTVKVQRLGELPLGSWVSAAD